MNHDEATRLIWDALGHAIAGDSEQAATALDTLGENSDNHQMYGVCCAIAASGTHVLKMLYGSNAPGDGDMWAFSELTPGALAQDPAEAFAMRFLIAYSNGDTDTCLALFEAALTAGGDQYVESVCRLLTSVAGLCRLALAEKDAGQLPSTKDGNR